MSTYIIPGSAVIQQSGQEATEAFLRALWKDPGQPAWGVIEKPGKRQEDGSLPLSKLGRRMRRVPKLPKLTEKNLEEDLFFCPALFASNENRSENNLLGTQCVWVDCDRPTALEDFLASCPVGLEPSIVVQSSEYKFHAYWLLTEFVQGVETIRRMNYALQGSIPGIMEADSSGFDANQVLRLPAGVNSKNGYEGAFRPAIVHWKPENEYAPEVFLELPHDDRPNAAWRYHKVDVVAEWDGELIDIPEGLSGKARDYLLNGGGTPQHGQSGGAYAVTLALWELGVEPGDIVGLLYNSQLAQHYNYSLARIEQDVARNISKKTATEPGGYKLNFLDKETPPMNKVSSWKPIDLTRVISEDYEPIKATLVPCNNREDICLLYAGKYHNLLGPSGEGKTLVAGAMVAIELLLGKRVLFIDFEDSEDVVVRDRLHDTFGVPAEILLTSFAYIRPQEKPAKDDPDWLELVNSDWDLVIIDAMTEAMSTFGYMLSGDSDGGAGKVARFNQELVHPFTNTGAAVLMIDHTSKGTEEALGSQHKKSGLTGETYAVRQKEKFGKGVRGRAVLAGKKDRPGSLSRYKNKNDEIAEFILDSRDPNSIRYYFDALVGIPTVVEWAKDESGVAVDPRESAIETVLRDNHGTSQNQILNALSGNRSANAKFLEKLVKEEKIIKESAKANGRAFQYYWVDKNGFMVGHPNSN